MSKRFEKVYVVDTCVIVQNPKFIEEYNSCDIVLPIITLEELDKIKSRDGDSGYRARQFFRYLKENELTSKLNDGIDLDRGNRLRTTLEYDVNSLPDTLDKDYGDNKILALDIFKDKDATLLTADISLIVKAEAMGIKAEPYTKGVSKTMKDLEKGYSEVEIEEIYIDSFYKNKKLSVDVIKHEVDIFPNKFFIVKALNNPKKSFLARYDADSKNLEPLEYGEQTYYGVKAKDSLQKFAIEALANPKIHLVTMSASQGVGKTYLSMAVALELVEEKGQYDSVLIGKNTAPIDKWSYQGYTQGNTETKLLSHFSNYASTLEALDRERSKYSKRDRMTGMELLLNRVEFTKSIEVLDIASILGASFNNKYVIVDECGSIPISTARSILTRGNTNNGEHNSKIVFIGDILQQTENRLDPDKSGLYCAIEWLKILNETAHITMKNTYRGSLCEKVAQIFDEKMYD